MMSRKLGLLSAALLSLGLVMSVPAESFAQAAQKGAQKSAPAKKKATKKKGAGKKKAEIVQFSTIG
jgi:hypothetical protein